MNYKMGGRQRRLEEGDHKERLENCQTEHIGTKSCRRKKISNLVISEHYLWWRITAEAHNDGTSRKA